MRTRLTLGVIRVPEPGPLFWFTSFGGARAPFYALRFDKFGELISPQTAEHLVNALEGGAYTDVVVCAHGWNNLWKTALANYRGFIDNLGEVHRRTGIRPEGDYLPLVIGIFWPSTSLVLPWERPPHIAGEAGDDEDPELDAWEVDDQTTVAELIAPSDRAEFYSLTDATNLDEEQARRLATLLVNTDQTDDEDLNGQSDANVSDLLRVWQDYEAPQATRAAPGAGGVRVPAEEGQEGEDKSDNVELPDAVAAGSFPRDPREILRLTTVRIMKDRAGKVGARGVASVLRRAIDVAPHTRFHLVGHSYGARLLLNAVSRPVKGPPLNVRSMLLLQPAVNHLCFADELPEFKGNPPGGYRAALTNVELPILTTKSIHDHPLRKVFHHALIRPKDIGEILIAGDDPPPSIYAALGGYGPGRIAAVKTVPMTDPEGTPAPDDIYDLDIGNHEVLVLNGNDKIADHGDVVTTATAWAMLSLIAKR